MLDKQRGCLYGLAVGDALGAAVEFMDRGDFIPVTDYRDGGPHNLDAGQWTDDTSMALALAESIAGGWNLDDQIKRYIDWWQNGKYSVNGWCFDIGGTTATSLTRYHHYNKNVWECADPHAASSGNGSIMRLAPVPMSYANFYPDQIDMLLNYCEQSSIPTHASRSCRSACKYLGLVLAAFIKGESRETVLSPDWHAKKFENEDPDILTVIKGSYRTKTEAQIKGSGWVVESLEAALWAFYDAPDFETAVLKAVNLGGDADTTGAICGQLAGAYWGEIGIPLRWRNGLDKKEMIEQAIRQCLC